jgi:hypothetical protein
MGLHYVCNRIKEAGIALSAELRVTGWTIWGSNAGGGRDRLRGKPRILHNGPSRG